MFPHLPHPLQVEAGLQSRLRALEEERQALSSQLVERERAEMRAREQHREETEALRAQHEEALQNVIH